MCPYLIGIGGCSGSGKSVMSRRLIDLLGASSAIVCLDSYYRDLSHLSLDQRSHCNFDHPDALDWDLLLSDLGGLRAGLTVEVPVYRFETHRRALARRQVDPSDFVLVEGILALYHRQVRTLLDLKVFVDTPDEECFRRRLERDVKERGRTPESVKAQYDRTVRPMALQYVLPSRPLADLIVSGMDPPEYSSRTIVQMVRHARPASA